MSGNLQDVILLFWCVSICLTLYLATSTYGVWIPVQYDVLLTVWCLRCLVTFTIWCLPTSMVSDYMYYVCPLVWCMLACRMSAYLCYVCLPVLCLPTYKMSAQLYVCFAWYMPTSMMSSYLHFVCLSVLFLLKYMMSVHVHDFCLPVLCLAPCTYKVWRIIRYC